jgi:hypothetical protein
MPFISNNFRPFVSAPRCVRRTIARPLRAVFGSRRLRSCLPRHGRPISLNSMLVPFPSWDEYRMRAKVRP